MNIDQLKSLQQRLRVATGADRELDLEIWDALGPTETIIPPGPRLPANYLAPRYTSYPDGLGVCVGLMTAVLPGAMWERYADGRICIGRAQLQWALGVKPLANDCLTFLDAIFSAVSQLEAQEKADV